MKLNNIYTYGEFKNVHNEGIWSAIKGLFKAIFAKVSKDVETKINNFTTKIEGLKDWKSIQTTMVNEVTAAQKSSESEFDNAKSLIDIRKINYDAYAYIYTISADISKKLGADALKPSNFLKDIKPDGILDQPNPATFDKNAIVALNALISGQAKKAGYTDQEIKEMIDDKEIKKEIETQTNQQQTNQQQTNQQQTNQQQTNQQQTNQQQTNQQQTNQQQTNQQQTNQQQTNQQTSESLIIEAETAASEPDQSNTENKGDIEKLKEFSKTDLTNTYQQISNKYKNYKFQGGVGNTAGNLANYTGKDPKGTVITGNANTVKNMAQGLRGMSKEQLIKMRKAQANILGDNSDGKNKFGAL